MITSRSPFPFAGRVRDSLPPTSQYDQNSFFFIYAFFTVPILSLQNRAGPPGHFCPFVPLELSSSYDNLRNFLFRVLAKPLVLFLDVPTPCVFLPLSHAPCYSRFPYLQSTCLPLPPRKIAPPPPPPPPQACSAPCSSVTLFFFFSFKIPRSLFFFFVI